MFWSWTDDQDNGLRPAIAESPTWGAQWDANQQTYPFGWFDPYDSYHANTVYGRYATVTMTWDFTDFTVPGTFGMADAFYDGSGVALGIPIQQSLNGLLGGMISP